MNRPIVPVILLTVVSASAAFLISIEAQTAVPQLTPGQPPQYHSVWDGIYTESQAGRGEALYHHECAGCHGDKLMGAGKDSEDAPALTGQEFQEEWKGRTVNDLFKKILRKMPQDDPGTLTPEQTADLLAFLLSFNKFPAGKTELPPDEKALKGIHFDGKTPGQSGHRDIGAANRVQERRAPGCSGT
jgi:S-disulfanyl-L-cysteine oxidoreductase SoxD